MSEREHRFDGALGWWSAEPDDRLPYRGNQRGVFYAQKGVVIGLDLRKAKDPTSVTFTRPPSFIVDGKAVNGVLPALLEQRCPDCDAPRLSLHDDDALPDDQLTCGGCGAMYELPTYVELHGFPAAVAWSARLEGRWGKGDDERAAQLAPMTVTAKGAQASKAALTVARSCRPAALALYEADDGALEQLGEQPRLEALRLWYTQISDAGLAAVGRFDALTYLDIGNNKRLGDEGLPQLAKLSRLTTINLEQTAITDAGLATLAKLPALERLILNATAITDAGLAALREHPKLREIALGSTRVTDDGLAHLKTLPSLDHVAIWSTRTSVDQGTLSGEQLREL